MKKNILLEESPLPFGAPQFDKIQVEDYLPAFNEAIEQAKKEIDAIAGSNEAPTFANTIEALEYSGEALSNVEGIFFNLLEAESSPRMQEIAEEVSPKLTEFEMYVSLNDALFARVKSVWEASGPSVKEPAEHLDSVQLRLLEHTYKSFARGGAALVGDDREKYAKLSEKLSLDTLKFSDNVLAATNGFFLHLTDGEDVASLPEYALEMGAADAKERNLEGWVYTLHFPSYSAFMAHSTRRDLREKLYMAYNTKAREENAPLIGEILSLRDEISRMLGYEGYPAYALEERMAKTPETVNTFLASLMAPSLPAARHEVDEILAYAREHGFEDTELRGWDFKFWSERYKEAKYSLSEEEIKPYLCLDNVIPAVFGLAHTLYGLEFVPRPDIPGYHPEVKVYDVNDKSGRHLALFYADFFPRAGKRGGAWMTEFRGQSFSDGVEKRPFISIVTNFTRPAGDKPSLLTHSELTTFLHEFGHALHGIMAEGCYPSMTGTNVARDFVELPSQLMENWAYEQSYLDSFARHYATGECIPASLVERIVASKNYLAGYSQVRQLHFGIIDMAWHSQHPVVRSGDDVESFEQQVLADYATLPHAQGTCTSTSFNHIFSGGYSAGYYSYKWAEVLEADAFELFKERGVLTDEVSTIFRREVLTKGDSAPADVLYRNFRGRDPEPDALLRQLGLK